MQWVHKFSDVKKKTHTINVVSFWIHMNLNLYLMEWENLYMNAEHNM